MARIIQQEIRQRGFFGKLFLGIFWIFNGLMCAWLISYWVSLSHQITSTGAEHAGKMIGGSIGSGVITFFWVAGAVILGLIAILTRGRKTIISEEVHQ